MDRGCKKQAHAAQDTNSMSKNIARMVSIPDPQQTALDALMRASNAIKPLELLDPEQYRAAQWELTDMMTWVRELANM